MNDQISRQKLKPCPFCGGTAIVDMDEYCYWDWHAWCFNCGCDIGHYATEEEAIEEWNKRAQPPADQWIPCSNPRKPINGQEIVVTVDLFGKWTHIATATYYTEKPKHWWEDEWDGEGFYQSHECGYCRREDVTAWFAVEPYKGE